MLNTTGSILVSVVLEGVKSSIYTIVAFATPIPVYHWSSLDLELDIYLAMAQVHVYPVDLLSLLDQSTYQGTIPLSFRSSKRRYLKGLTTLRVYTSMQTTALATHHSLK